MHTRTYNYIHICTFYEYTNKISTVKKCNSGEFFAFTWSWTNTHTCDWFQIHLGTFQCSRTHLRSQIPINIPVQYFIIHSCDKIRWHDKELQAQAEEIELHTDVCVSVFRAQCLYIHTSMWVKVDASIAHTCKFIYNTIKLLILYMNACKYLSLLACVQLGNILFINSHQLNE